MVGEIARSSHLYFEALFVLPPNIGMFKTSFGLLGLNHQSNYVARGLENRAAYDKFIELAGDIETNKMVVCRDGFGKLVSESEDSLTISLEPWQFEKTYSAVLDTEGEMGTARGQARLARWEPSLDEYQREERSDTVPAE